TTGTGCFVFSDTLFSTAFDTTVPSVEIDSESILSVVAGTELTLDVLTNNAGENPDFQWYVNGLPVEDGNGNQFTFIPENGDTVFVTMTVEDDYPCITTTFDQSDEVVVYTCTGPPIAYDVWGSREICLYYGDFSFGLTDTEPGVEYFVYCHSAYGGEVYIINEFSGTGEPYTVYGYVGDEYWIQGVNACDTTMMNGNVIATYFDERAYISASANNICSGTPVTFTAHLFRNDTITYLFDWIVNGITVYNGRQQFTYTPENGDFVTARMSYPCPGQEYNNFILMVVWEAQGSTTTWTGGSGSDWQNPENWSNGVPQSDFNVNIPGGCLHYPILTSYAACEIITIEDGGSFIGSEFLNEKSALIKCNLSSPEFHFLSSPVYVTREWWNSYYPTFGSVFPENQQTIWARQYNEYSGDWVNLKFDSYLWEGEGYSIQSTQPRTAQFIGLLNYDAAYCGITQSNPGSDPDRVGWNLLGNPFPCSLDWDLIPNSTAEQAVYVWNGTQYISWNGTVGALADGIIPPMNGFFVKALNLNYSLFIIPLSARVHSNVPFYKESITNLIELQVTCNNYSDVTFIHFNSEATAGFDAHSDARKLRGIEAAPQLFSYAGGKELSINEQPFEPAVVIELGFTCGKSGNFILNGKGLESFNNNVRIMLEDQKKGIFQNLSDNAQYNFNYIAGESEHRFKLHFTENSSNPESAEVIIYNVDNTVIVNNFTGLSGEIQVFDFTGRMILNSTIDSGNQHSFTLNAAAGPYIVKVITAKGVQSQKVVLM
ncbi:MAG: T9SS type A sorting domain-containing protein, partial [Bacteroidota bacterium]